MKMQMTPPWTVFLLLIFISCKSRAIHDFEPESHVNLIGDSVQDLSVQIWYIFQDSKGDYWYASNGEGVFKYDGRIILNYTLKHGLANDTIRQIQEDTDGNIYFSTMGGISQFNGSKFKTLPVIESKEWKLEPTDMWFYMLGKKDENGPYRYDGKNLYHLKFPKHFLHDEFYEAGINPFFSPYEIYSIYKDRKGYMWFGTSVFGACRFDGKNIHWMYERDLTIAPNGGSFGIRSIFEDQEGKFWFCNTRHRFDFDFQLTQTTGRLQYQKIHGIGTSADFGGDETIYYSHIVEDESGDIWLTTWDQGVFRYGENGISNYPVKDGESNVNLVSMYQDKQGKLWLGTSDHGVYFFNGDGFERFLPKVLD